MTSLNYNHGPGKRYCDSINMLWDAEFAARADALVYDEGLTQDQWDLLIREHAWRIKWLFSPRNYSWRDRLAIALFFLNPFAKKDPS